MMQRSCETMLNSLESGDFRREILRDMAVTWNAEPWQASKSRHRRIAGWSNRVVVTHNPLEAS